MFAQCAGEGALATFAPRLAAPVAACSLSAASLVTASLTTHHWPDGGRQLAKEKHCCVSAVSQHDVIWHAMMRVMGACRRAARRSPLAACHRLPGRGRPLPGAYFSQSSDDKSIHILPLLLTIVLNIAFQRFQCN